MKPVVCAGKVVSTAAFDVLKDWISDVFLLDINIELAKGEDLDIIQVVPVIEVDKEIQGTGDIIEMEGSELVIVVAGQGRNPSLAQIDLMSINSIQQICL